MSTLTERMAQLPPARRKRVDERALALIAEEMSRSSASIRRTCPVSNSAATC